MKNKRLYLYGYKPCWAPYPTAIKAYNIKDFWKRIKEIYPKYNVKKVIVLYGKV